MWPFDHTFGTYGWPGPFGWVAHNCPGNVVAGFIQVALAGLAAALIWPPTRKAIIRFAKRTEERVIHPITSHIKAQTEHAAWMAKQTAALAEAAGLKVTDHPHFGSHDDLATKHSVDHAKDFLGADHPAYAEKASA